MRIWSVMLAAAIAAAIALWIWGGQPAANQAAQSETIAEAATPDAAPVRVLARAFDAALLERSVTLRGLTQAARSVEVKAQTGGLVISEPLQKGARVAEGDLLCRIELGDREASLEEAKAKLAQAEADFAASTQLSTRGYSADATVAADRAALEAARGAVRRMEIDIERLEIRAPFAGVLETDAAEIGALLQAGSVCAHVIAVDPIRFVGFAGEADVGAIETGRQAEARLLDGRVVPAEITFVARAADADTRTFRVEATAANPTDREGGQIRDGATAELHIPIEAAMGHKIPSAALTLDDDGRLGVRIVGDAVEGRDGVMRASFKPVRILADEPDGIWVAGLSERETVIVRGHEYVSDGSLIRPTIETTPPARDTAPEQESAPDREPAQ